MLKNEERIAEVKRRIAKKEQQQRMRRRQIISAVCIAAVSYTHLDVYKRQDYTNTGSNSKMFNSRIRDRICDLSKTLAAAESTEEFMKDMVQFYKDFGVGKLGLHKAFRVGHDENDNVEIQPITRIAHVKLEDLVGYEIPKQKLIENTDCLLYTSRCV